MWRWDDEIVEDLRSGDATRIGAAIRDLTTRMDDADEFELAPLGAGILEPFGDTVPEDVELAFLKLLARYRAFVPPLSPGQRYAALIDLLLRYPTPAVAYETALYLKTADDPLDAVGEALGHVDAQGLSSPTRIGAAQSLVDFLLDGTPAVRAATLHAVARWSDDDATRDVVASILPALDPDERALLQR